MNNKLILYLLKYNINKLYYSFESNCINELYIKFKLLLKIYY